MTFHEAFGKVFTAFELCSCLGRANHGDSARALIVVESVGNAVHKRVFRADNQHVDGVTGCESLDGLEVVDLQVDILATVPCTGIPRCNIEFVTFLALGNLPCEGMLAPSAS